MSVANISNPKITAPKVHKANVTTMAVRLARANELNLKRILAKGEEVEDKDILDALVDPLHRTSLYVDEDQGCFVKVENRIDKALETFTPVNELTLVTSKNTSTKLKQSKLSKQSINKPLLELSEKWRGYAIDFSLVMAFLAIVLYGISTA